MKRTILLAGLAAVAGALSCSGDTAYDPGVPAIKILFIGNSFTDINGGVDTFFKGLASNAQASRIAPGGATLLNHAQNTSTTNAIKNGNWDYVVMQEQSQVPATNPDYFLSGATALNNVIAPYNAEALLFMTWERPDSLPDVSTFNLAKAYDDVGAQLNVRVVPVGLAFAEALKNSRSPILNASDGHPTPAGTYLAACVFYGFIFKKSPVGNPYLGGLSASDAAFLQQVAATQLRL